MPNIATATDTICGHFNTLWAERTPIDWPNVTNSGPHLREGSVPWVGFDLMLDGGEDEALGGKLFNRQGTLTVRIFVPAGERGLEASNLLVMAACDAFEGKTIDGVSFYRVGPKTVGLDGAWFQVNVRAEFEFDEAK